MSPALATRGPRDAQHLARQVIAHHSKSFALAARLLPRSVRNDAQVLYAFCRRADDAVDEAQDGRQAERLAGLRAELDAVYAQPRPADALLAALQDVVQRCAVPRSCFDDLLDGMAMDVAGYRYAHLEQLLLYCYRVAGTVGLMMCHVMGVRHPEALRRATHLGIAMQLTNVARDVAEDWRRGRLYLPEALLGRHRVQARAALRGGALPAALGPALSRVNAELLRLADVYYASGDDGLSYLPPRCAFGVRAARLIYAEIGQVLRHRGCDPRAGRAVVSKARKLALVLRAALHTGWSTLRGGLRPGAERRQLSAAGG
jgi:phytoene synthase